MWRRYNDTHGQGVRLGYQKNLLCHRLCFLLYERPYENFVSSSFRNLMIHEQQLIDGNDNKPYSFSFAPNELSSLVGTDHLLSSIYM